MPRSVNEFEVVVQLSTQSAITRMRSQLRFEAAALQLLSATTGDVVRPPPQPVLNMKSAAPLDVHAPAEPVQEQVLMDCASRRWPP